jgi:RNA polymerase sigma-70 factor (ECF subfamily)
VLRAQAVASMQRVLVEQAMDGDIDAYSELVKASHSRLFGIAHLILRDTDRAQDAVQDALLLAWRHVRSLRDPDAWDAWLRRLTVRACYRVARAHKRRTLVELHTMPSSGSPRAPDASLGVLDRDWLGRELDRLDIDQRVVLVLHYYLDLPLSEVAEIVDIPYGTAASRLHRGLEAMRTSMLAEPRTDGALLTERPS